MLNTVLPLIGGGGETTHGFGKDYGGKPKEDSGAAEENGEFFYITVASSVSRFPNLDPVKQKWPTKMKRFLWMGLEVLMKPGSL